jgi:pimeloyl-ACP methyl ester carboxylesterase
VPYATAADGTRIAYELCGREGGEPLVLIQGLSADRRGWLMQRGALGERYRLLLVDNRGVGESDRPAGPYDLGEMADDVLAVLDEVGWASAHVMGASMGGVIAQILGVLHPERVRSLVLACTACRHAPWRRELLEAWKATALDEGMKTFAQRNAKWLVGPRSVRRFWPVLNLFGGLALNAEPDAFAAQVDAILQADETLRHALSGVTAPTIVIVGSQDVLTPMADAEEVAEAIPGSLLAVVRGGAHGFMFEHSKVFNSTVLTFLDTVTAEASGVLRRLPAA